MNSGKIFWLKSLFKNKFDRPVGLKLAGTVGNKRRALKEEIESVRKHIKPLRIFKGYHTLWGGLEYVREIKFVEYYPINVGDMTFNL